MSPVDVFLALIFGVIAIAVRLCLDKNANNDFALHVAFGSFAGSFGAVIALSPVAHYGKVEIFITLLSAYFVGDVGRRLMGPIR